MSLTFFNMYREQEEGKQVQTDSAKEPAVTEPLVTPDGSTNENPVKPPQKKEGGLGKEKTA